MTPLQIINLLETLKKIQKKTKENVNNSWWNCCCCRKKTKAELEELKRTEEAHRRIEDSLDVLTIVRNFNYLQVLTSFFFEKRHYELAQYVGFDLWRKHLAEMEHNNPSVTDDGIEINQASGSYSARNKTKSRLRIAGEKVKFINTMTLLKKKHKEYRGLENIVNPQVVAGLDDFFLGRLSGPDSSVDPRLMAEFNKMRQIQNNSPTQSHLPSSRVINDADINDADIADADIADADIRP